MSDDVLFTRSVFLPVSLTVSNEDTFRFRAKVAGISAVDMFHAILRKSILSVWYVEVEDGGKDIVRMAEALSGNIVRLIIIVTFNMADVSKLLSLNIH